MVNIKKDHIHISLGKIPVIKEQIDNYSRFLYVEKTFFKESELAEWTSNLSQNEHIKYSLILFFFSWEVNL